MAVSLKASPTGRSVLRPLVPPRFSASHSTAAEIQPPHAG